MANLQFVPLTLDFQAEMQARLGKITDGISEFTFANLYLFRQHYAYQVFLGADGQLVISGTLKGQRFFMTPCALPDKDTLLHLFETHAYWRLVPDSLREGNRETLAEWGVTLAEDRAGFDYLYLRSELAELSGKKFHKKRNLVNAFLNSYVCEAQPLGAEQIPDALNVLERWRTDKGDEGDYDAAREALERFETLGLRGALYSIHGKPVGWCLGESLANGTMFAIHFEKGIDEYKGIYQFINQNFAASLPEQYALINREQDLGDEGLRQAKLTYRPVGFVKKHRGELLPSSGL
jgi:hypothetical protein